MFAVIISVIFLLWVIGCSVYSMTGRRINMTILEINLYVSIGLLIMNVLLLLIN